MIKQIEKEKCLRNYITRKISDAGLEVGVDDTLTESDYIAVKVDDYYNGLKLEGETPKSVDFIVSVDCQCSAYVLYVLELKNTKSASFTTKSIQEKFETAFEDFMKIKFEHIYLNPAYKYKDIQLYVVSKAYIDAAKYGNYENFKKIMGRCNRDTANRDMELSDKPYFFRKKAYRIKREFPPNPIIRRVL
jgi:predicted small secreted protein